MHGHRRRLRPAGLLPPTLASAAPHSALRRDAAQRHQPFSSAIGHPLLRSIGSALSLLLLRTASGHGDVMRWRQRRRMAVTAAGTAAAARSLTVRTNSHPPLQLCEKPSRGHPWPPPNARAIRVSTQAERRRLQTSLGCGRPLRLRPSRRCVGRPPTHARVWLPFRSSHAWVAFLLCGRYRIGLHHAGASQPWAGRTPHGGLGAGVGSSMALRVLRRIHAIWFLRIVAALAPAPHHALSFSAAVAFHSHCFLAPTRLSHFPHI